MTEDAAWVTDLNPPKIIKFDLEGTPTYVFNLPVDGPNMRIEMHSFSIDEGGNLYGTDNQAGRPLKLVPKPGSDPTLIHNGYMTLVINVFLVRPP